MKRILVIRGGAIGDFILTLPALGALRDAYRDAEIHVLGYKHIADLVNNRFYANSVRSIEYAALASFFAKDTDLPTELADYFATFDLILTYLFDPDLIFERNLRRCGVEEILRGPAKISADTHAAAQLARPLQELGLNVEDLRGRLFPSKEDREFAQQFLQGLPQPVVAIHPGSGSDTKNWPLENWIQLLSAKPSCSIVIVSGEADEKQTARLESLWRGAHVRFAKNLPLPHLAAILENAFFIGHDSGISHLAAAVSADCTLLFGPTDPDVWAPKGDNVRILRAPDGDLTRLDVEAVRSCVAAFAGTTICSSEQLPSPPSSP